MLRLQKRQSKAFTVLFTPINRALDALDNWYARMLNWAVRHRAIVLAACFGFMFLSFFCAKFIGTEFFPAQDNGRIAVKLELPIGSRKELAQELADKLTKQWREKYQLHRWSG
jgi:HAE1 family hydrophobic/amphiphilic exporter-1